MNNTENIIENIAIVKEQAALEDAREAVEDAGFLKFVDVDRDFIVDLYGRAMVNAFRVMDSYITDDKPDEWTDVRDYKSEPDFTFSDLGREVYYMMQDDNYRDILSGKTALNGWDCWRWLVSVHNSIADMIHATIYGGNQDRYIYTIAGDNGPVFTTMGAAWKYRKRTGATLTAHTWTTNVQFLAEHFEN